MEVYGNVTAPTFDYRNPVILEGINTSFEYDENTILIGSSFGGYLAYEFSMHYDIPCLLFNPALVFRSIPGLSGNAEAQENKITNLTYVVLGKKDTIINSSLNMAYVNRYIKGPSKIVTEEDMKHRIPLPIFQRHVKVFFELLISGEAPP